MTVFGSLVPEGLLALQCYTLLRCEPGWFGGRNKNRNQSWGREVNQYNSPLTQGDPSRFTLNMWFNMFVLINSQHWTQKYEIIGLTFSWSALDEQNVNLLNVLLLFG